MTAERAVMYYYVLFSNTANHSLNLFVSFCISGLKENIQSLNYYILRRDVELYALCFQLTVSKFFFFWSLLANAVNSGYDRGERCLSVMFIALLTCWQ